MKDCKGNKKKNQNQNKKPTKKHPNQKKQICYQKMPFLILPKMFRKPPNSRKYNKIGIPTNLKTPNFGPKNERILLGDQVGIFFDFMS